MHGEAGVVGFSRTDRRMHVSASTIFENTDFEMFLSLSLSLLLFFDTLYERRGFQNWNPLPGPSCMRKGVFIDIKAVIRRPHQRASSNSLL
jgi:hypothetical protein